MKTPGPLREKLEVLVLGAAKEADPRGCFLCNASIDQAQFDPDTRETVQAMMQALLKAFQTAFGPGREDEAAPTQAAYHGLRVMAAAGLPREVLLRVVKGALGRVSGR